MTTKIRLSEFLEMKWNIFGEVSVKEVRNEIFRSKCAIGVNPGGWGGRDPPDFGQGGRGGRRGSWTGRKILYLIMYRKYVRKWWLWKRNRIICLEIAVNSQFLPEKSKLFVKFALKIELFVKLPVKIDFFEKCALKNHFFVKLPEKNPYLSEMFLENRIFCEIA